MSARDGRGRVVGQWSAPLDQPPGAGRRPALALGLGLCLAGCTTVDVVRLTNQQFPAKRSVREVEVLQATPKCPHLDLAELSVDESSAGFSTMQEKMLEKGAELGADAVVFGPARKEIRHESTHVPTMKRRPGPPIMAGQSGRRAVPDDVPVKSLAGLAIRYRTGTGSKC